jgi:hypothetical protein
LAFGDDVWKAEENGRIVVCRHHDCHHRGGARGERTEEREGKNDKIVTVFNDNGNDGIAVRRTGRSPSIRRRCARYPIMPSRWGCCEVQSSAAPPSSSV